MTDKPDFDRAAAHQYFSADCFNKAWGLIDKVDRTPAEDQQMIRLSQASIWHWTQREDCTDKNMSIGYWQASRIYALLGQSANAREYGQLALDTSEEQVAFYGAMLTKRLPEPNGWLGIVRRRGYICAKLMSWRAKLKIRRKRRLWKPTWRRSDRTHATEVCDILGLCWR